MAVSFSWSKTEISVSGESGEAELVLETQFTDVIVRFCSLDDGLEVANSQLLLNGPAGSRRIVPFTFKPNRSRGELRAEIKDVVRSHDEPTFQRGKRKVQRIPKARTANASLTVPDPLHLEVMPRLAEVGNVPVELKVIVRGAAGIDLTAQYPPGWLLEMPSERSLWPNETRILKVVATPSAQNADLVLMDSEGRCSATVKLVRKQSVGVQRIPQFIIALDFGTSGTSIAYVSTTEQVLNPQSLPSPEFLGLGNRFPTLFFLKDISDQGSWSYGQKAQNESTNQDGLLVSDLKKLLWQNDDTIQCQDGRQVSAFEILCWYFKMLRQDLIDPRIKELARASLDDIQIAWRIAIPVLEEDQERLFATRIEQAFDQSLRSNHDTLDLIYEPDAALRAVLAWDPQGEISKIEVGDSIMIVDSGAGTTDVSFGYIVDDHSARIRVNSRASVRLKRARDEGKIASDSFGGGDVTRLAAVFAMLDWAQQDSAGPADVRLKLSKLKESPKRNSDWFKPDDSGRLTAFPVSTDPSLYWHNVAPKLYCNAELAKLDIQDNAKEQSTLSASVKPIMDLKKEQFIAAVDYLAGHFRQELIDLTSEITEGRPKFVVYVGGNMLLRQFRNAVLPGSVVSVHPPDDLIKLAVVKGLCLFDLRSTTKSLIRLSLLTGESDKQIIYETRGGAIITDVNKRVQFQIPTQESLRPRILREKCYEGAWYEVEMKPLPEHLGLVQIGTRVEGDGGKVFLVTETDESQILMKWS